MIGAVGVLPIGLVLLLLLKTIRRMQMRPIELPPWQPQIEEPPGGDPSGDREPRRPLMPARSGAAALPEPTDDEADLARFVLEQPSPASDPRHGRLAG